MSSLSDAYDGPDAVARAVKHAFDHARFDIVGDSEPEPNPYCPRCQSADGEHCQTCGRTYPMGGWWHAPNDLWQRVTGQEEGLRCPDCFGHEANAKGITLVWHVHEYEGRDE